MSIPKLYKRYHTDKDYTSIGLFRELNKKFNIDKVFFVGQAAKPYLKKGGLLVCNNSHGDASMASLDPDFYLIAVYNRLRDDKFSISEKNLEGYLKPKNGIEPTRDQLLKSMKGKGYTKSLSGYI